MVTGAESRGAMGHMIAEKETRVAAVLRAVAGAAASGRRSPPGWLLGENTAGAQAAFPLKESWVYGLKTSIFVAPAA